MEENIQPPQPAENIPDTLVKPVKQKSNFLILILSILALLLLVTTGFLYYQNQQLKTILAIYQTQSSPTPTASSEGKVPCSTKRPEVCTMECMQNPPYICGSDGKSYCSTCQACANSEVQWYEMSATPCKQQ